MKRKLILLVFVYSNNSGKNFSGQMENRRIAGSVCVCRENRSISEKNKKKKRMKIRSVNNRTKIRDALLKVLHRNDGKSFVFI